MSKSIRRYKKICSFCHKDYLALRRTQKTCSIKCRADSQRKPLIEIICSCCGEVKTVKSKYRNKKFCSQSCASSFNNRKYKTYEYMEGKNNPSKRKEVREKISNTLKGRDNFWMRGKNNHNHKSNGGIKNEVKEKMSVWRTGRFTREKHWNWRGGIALQEYGSEWTDELRTFVRKRDRFCCVLCNKNGFCVHHIDYNKKNNNTKNLITLCRSCHIRTNYSREHWKEQFEERVHKNGR